MKHFKGVLSVLLLITAISITGCSTSSGSGDNDEESTYIGTKAPTEAKAVGDIVFNDGSAMAYSDFAALKSAKQKAKKASAIALIFYKGTGLNSDDSEGNADTSTSRTLGVGLKHKRSGLAWCRRTSDTDKADAYSVNITTIECPASGGAGVLTFTGDKNGSDNLEQIEAFEGVDDTARAENYPAFYFGKNYATNTVTNIAADSEFATGWYLPSIAELFQIYACRADTSNGFDIDAASQVLGGDAFEDLTYWASSQFKDSKLYFAYTLDFNKGDWLKCVKWAYDVPVCCIREFN